MSHTGGNVHGLLLCISINPDHKPRCIFLVLDPDMFRRLAAGTLSVFPNIKAPLNSPVKSDTAFSSFHSNLIHP